jgi:flagellar biosynthesis protein FlhF
VARFGEIGATAMLVTKLDEASGLGNLLPVVRSAGLSLSYLTCGQSVPDDIVDADKDKLVRAMLGWEPLASLS